MHITLCLKAQKKGCRDADREQNWGKNKRCRVLVNCHMLLEELQYTWAIILQVLDSTKCMQHYSFHNVFPQQVFWRRMESTISSPSPKFHYCLLKLSALWTPCKYISVFHRLFCAAESRYVSLLHNANGSISKQHVIWWKIFLSTF